MLKGFVILRASAAGAVFLQTGESLCLLMPAVSVALLASVKYGEKIVICPRAIAYSMGQIIKSVCVCLSICEHSHGCIS